MNTNLPPILEDVINDHFPRMKGLRRDPCAACTLKAVCEAITCPKIGPEDIEAPKGAEE
jgi:hypothetical protein